MKKLLTKLFVKKEMAKLAMAESLKSERGDTNFISIIIILGIVVILVGVFLGFKDQIIGTISGIVSGFEVH
jgi:hypothetical protein